MVFSSAIFVFLFLPLVLLCYFLSPRKLKNYVLLFFSLVFYVFGGPKFLLVLLAVVLIDYVGAILINKTNKKKLFLILTITCNILVLVYFKYTGFFLENVNSIFGLKITIPKIVLPIGISFYTFQAMSYVIDVYRNKVKLQKNFLTLLLYVSLFPQLVAGPIVRYETIEDELNNRKETFNDISEGIKRFILGLAKKVIIANQMGLLADTIFGLNELSTPVAILGGIAYMFQIYFDFSAYSDMAIGLGRIFGFKFLENFNFPYISKSITEFWRRWHISLGSWFRDYVYIPLGGNRKGKLILLRNIFIVWFLTGFWHGASWNFIIWGLMFGIILIIEKLWLHKYLEKLPAFVQSLYVLFIVMISFIIFNADNMSIAIKNIAGLFGLNGEVFINEYTIYNLKSYAFIIVVAILAATPLFKNIIEKLKTNEFMNKIINVLEPIFIVILLLIVTAYLIDNSYNPFLYFRF